MVAHLSGYVTGTVRQSLTNGTANTVTVPSGGWDQVFVLADTESALVAHIRYDGTAAAAPATSSTAVAGIVVPIDRTAGGVVIQRQGSISANNLSVYHDNVSAQTVNFVFFKRRPE